MDLRKPSGWFFVLTGAILVVAALVDPSARAPLTSVNVNLYAGSVMMLFGGILLWLAKLNS